MVTDEEFRAIGYTGEARKYPRDVRGLVVAAAWNNIAVGDLTPAMRYYPNAQMKQVWERVINAIPRLVETRRWTGPVDPEKVATDELIDDIKYRIRTFTAPSFDAGTMSMVINLVGALITEIETGLTREGNKQWPNWGDRPDGFDGPTGAE